MFGEGVTPVASINWLPELLQKKSITPHVALRVNNIYGIYRAVQAGIGIGTLPEYFMQEGRGIVRVLPEIFGPPLDCYFVYPEELRQSARVSVFRDFLVKELAKAKLQTAGLDVKSDPALGA
jgi:DNA-binding transcriptional LysR family regulator